MISHKYKCIFVHIPRTAGSSIEHWICGDDWWEVSPSTKHLVASVAKDIYKDYWGSYFKFAFVRNPWDRCISCLKQTKYFGIEYKGELHFEEYKKRFGSPVTIEHDHRFYNYNEIRYKNHSENTVYLNILDEEMDFIGRYEHLEKDTNFIKNTLNIPTDFPLNTKYQQSKKDLNYRGYYNIDSIKEVQSLYRKDIDEFNYEF